MQIKPYPMVRPSWYWATTALNSPSPSSRLRAKIQARITIFLIFLCVFVSGAVGQECSDKSYREAVRLVRALYPELTGRGAMLDLVSRPYLDSDSFPTTFDLAVSETPPSPSIPGTNQKSEADRVGHLGSRFQFDARDQRFISMFASGSLVATEKQNALNQLIEQHPEWTEAQMTDALVSSGAIFGPGQKERVLAKFPTSELEPILGKIQIVSAEFDFRGNKEPPFYAVMHWTVYFRVGSKERKDEYFAWVEPFSGRVVGLGGR